MIEVTNFSKVYTNGKKAVDDISFTVNDGRYLVFLDLMEQANLLL